MMFARSGATVADDKAYGWGKRGVAVTTFVRELLDKCDRVESEAAK